jgi:dTDP-L-rhamnose 4-epimerase
MCFEIERNGDSMPKIILITGGAGFIGSHLADDLLEQGYGVRVLDSLDPQVHPDGARPRYLSRDVELVVGDVRDGAALRRALEGVDAVFHLAALVGVGQSMYRIDDYTAVNDLGTAVLLQALIERPVERLITASSMSIYGEGLYLGPEGRRIENAARQSVQFKNGDWDPLAEDGTPLQPLPTPEDKQPSLASVYALGKYVQERMPLIVGGAYGIAATALRFFNVFGARQALSNPYTGVLAIFASRLMNGRPPLIYEDGQQRRDFVHVRDVACACRLALERPETTGLAINVGSGRSYTIDEVAVRLADALGKPEIRPEITGRYRVGDIRHCFADMTLARERLGFEPRYDLESGLGDLVEWLEGQIAIDRVDQAAAELSARGLVA